MDLLPFLIGGCLLLGLALAVLLAGITWRRAARVGELERRLRGIERKLDALEHRDARAPETPRAAPAPDWEPAAQRAPPTALAPPLPPLPGGTAAATASQPVPESASGAESVTPRAAERAREPELAPKAASGWPPEAATAPSPARASEEPTPRGSIEWERWIGVRGAAAVGGIVLALAAILLFQHALAHGWISPALRAGIGGTFGASCIVAAAWLRRSRFAVAPSALEGAGLVALYATAWYSRFAGLVSFAVAFPAMAAITLLAGLLSVRHGSRLVVVLALVGGFATPLLLASGEDRPIGLFGYVLLLDLGLLLIGRRQAWPWLSLLALAGTLLIQALWIFARMGPERSLLGLAILAVFALVFALAPSFLRTGAGSAFASRALGALYPFVFALYFAGRAELRVSFPALAGFIGLLAAVACWIARSESRPALAFGAASGALGVLGAWLLREAPPSAAVSAQIALASAALGVVFHAFGELAPRSRAASGARAAASGTGAAAIGDRAAALELAPATFAAAGGLLLVAAATALASGLALGAWVAATVALGLLLARQATRGGSAVPAWLGCALQALGLIAIARRWVGPPPGGELSPETFLALALGFALAWTLGGARLGRESAGRPLLQGACILAALVPFALPIDRFAGDGRTLLGLLAGAGLLGWIGAFAASGASSSAWFALAGLAALSAHGLVARALSLDPAEIGTARLALALSVLAGAGFALAPALASRGWRRSRWIGLVSALLTLAWLAVVQRLAERALDPRLALAPGAALGLAALAATALALRRAAARALDVEGSLETEGPGGEDRLAVASASSALAAFGFALGFQGARESFAVGSAVAAGALAGYSRRARLRSLEHAPLLAALVFGALATARLAFGALAPGYYARSEARLWNELSWVHLAPAAALLAGGALASRESPGVSPTRLRRYGAGLVGLFGLVVVFLWIDLEILNAFSSEPRLAFRLERLPARDLSLSIAWVLYSLVLLGLGMARGRSGLRWASLALFSLTLAKVFLYDLGELEGLYRVASLAGLALSLIGVSLLYQRFVFARAARPALARPE